jgi:hypothetical protein
MPLLAVPDTVTTTFPLVAPFGTAAVIVVAPQAVAVAAVPLNLTVLVPCVAPKFNPVMVTLAPIAPDVGDSVLRIGPTVNVTPLLTIPLTVTTTLPVVAPLGTTATIWVLPQLAAVAAVPLKVTVLAPCALPKFVPLIVTEDPVGPEVGLRVVIVGFGNTLKDTPLLVTPATATNTFPVVAPAGTGTTI